MARRRDFRQEFMNASRAVLECRARFDANYSSASKDSERYALEKQFPRDMTNLYEHVNGILDDYNEQLRLL